MGRLKVIVSAALVIVLLGTVGFIFTKDGEYADHTSEETMLELKTNEKTSEDILKKNQSTQVNALFRQYYAQRTEEEGFTEGYDEIAVYTLSAKEDEDFITYVTYQMKIKDVDTTLPGLESFYVNRTDTGIYQVEDISTNQELQNEIAQMSQRQDVLELIRAVEDDYAKAKQNDPGLDAALLELQNAYQ